MAFRIDAVGLGCLGLQSKWSQAPRSFKDHEGLGFRGGPVGPGFVSLSDRVLPVWIQYQAVSRSTFRQARASLFRRAGRMSRDPLPSVPTTVRAAAEGVARG